MFLCDLVSGHPLPHMHKGEPFWPGRCRIGQTGYRWMYRCELDEGHPLPHQCWGQPFRPGSRGCDRRWHPIDYQVDGKLVKWDPKDAVEGLPELPVNPAGSMVMTLRTSATAAWEARLPSSIAGRAGD